MHFHSQNLKEAGDKSLLHWRCWLHTSQSTFKFSVSVPSSFWHIHIDFCENGWQEEAVGFSVACPLFAVWLGVDNGWLYDKLEKVTRREGERYTNGRSIGISWHNSTLWVNIWADEMEGRSSDPWWWDFNIDFADLILGKSKYQTKVIKTGDTFIDMPEGQYGCTYEVVERSWKRPRWFGKKRTSIDFEIPLGIPHWGKGENSWDCGMDATFGTGVQWKGRLHKAVREVTENLLKTRMNRGSLSDKASTTN